MHSEQIEFLFNLSMVARSEKVLTAELHLFKLRPQASATFNRYHFCQVYNSMWPIYICIWQTCRDSTVLYLLKSNLCKANDVSIHSLQISVYQLLNSSKMNITQGKKLLSSRLIPVHSTGWEVFTITQAVIHSLINSLIHPPTHPPIPNHHIPLPIKVCSWMVKEGSNLGLLVTVWTLGGSQMDQKVVCFILGRNHHHAGAVY